MPGELVTLSNLDDDAVANDATDKIHFINMLEGSGEPVAAPPVPEKVWIYADKAEDPVALYTWDTVGEDWNAAGGGGTPASISPYTEGFTLTAETGSTDATTLNAGGWTFGIDGASDFVTTGKTFTPGHTGDFTGLVIVQGYQAPAITVIGAMTADSPVAINYEMALQVMPSGTEIASTESYSESRHLNTSGYGYAPPMTLAAIVTDIPAATEFRVERRGSITGTDNAFDATLALPSMRVYLQGSVAV